MEREEKQKILSRLPKVDALMAELDWHGAPRSAVLQACRGAVDNARNQILAGQADAGSHASVLADAQARLARLELPSLRPVINATGVIVHTNLGRSLLPESIMPALAAVACGYSNLEYNLEQGRRGSRYSHVEKLLCTLTGAESALVVNNNAAAVLLCLDTLAKGMEVIVSRGELVEIGGSFRIPDVMARSGAILREVGATNRTHLRDYRAAVNEKSALFMKVHQSNFSVVGFTSAVSVARLAGLAREHGLYLFEDLGSGTLIDFSRYGLQHEPTVQESLSAGADLVSFSGDKLLGGPQAGIIVGRRDLVERIKTNPMNRAVRIDKLTLVALEQILRLYRDPDRAVREIPTLSMMCAAGEDHKKRARRLAGRIRKVLKNSGHDVSVRLRPTVARAGGGALPLQEIPSTGVSISGDHAFSAASVEEALRRGDPPVVVRVENNQVIMDVCSVRDSEFKVIARALGTALGRGEA